VDAIEIVGAGGIGCAVGYALAAAGVGVTFIEANPRKIAWGRANGVQVDQRPPQRAEFVPFEEWSPRPGSAVILCTKSYDNPAILARLPAGVHLIPVQNGFDRALSARGESVEGIASFVSECLPDRPHTRITRRGRLHLGIRPAGNQSLPDGVVDARVQQLAGLLRLKPCFPVETVADILPYKHTKLMYNAAIGPLAAMGGLDNGDLLAVAVARRWFFALLRENFRILREADVPLGTIGPFHPVNVNRILRRSWLARALSWAFYPSLRGTYCSMHGDIPTGRTEIDHYNGYLIELAGGRPCPLNQRIFHLVKRMEAERIQPGPAAFEELGPVE
jgi:2-dehydropantoate 2-reductase